MAELGRERVSLGEVVFAKMTEVAALNRTGERGCTDASTFYGMHRDVARASMFAAACSNGVAAKSPHDLRVVHDVLKFLCAPADLIKKFVVA